MMTQLIRSIRCFLFDMDGTIYLGDRLLPGAAAFIRHLEEIDFPFYFLTNNSSRSNQDYADKLERQGLPTKPGRIITSGEATAIYLQERNPSARVFLAGTPSLEGEFKHLGFHLADEDPEIAVLGFDTTLTYQKLATLCHLVRSGIPYIATHPDINCPTEDGFIPDIGAIMALVKASTGRDPDIIVGKPHTPIVEAILAKTGYTAPEILMVGDRLYTDIAMGAVGLRTALVLTGEARREDIPSAPHPPDLVVSDLADLSRMFSDRVNFDQISNQNQTN